jgi:hypothetical protein
VMPFAGLSLLLLLLTVAVEEVIHCRRSSALRAMLVPTEMAMKATRPVLLSTLPMLDCEPSIIEQAGESLRQA